MVLMKAIKSRETMIQAPTRVNAETAKRFAVLSRKTGFYPSYLYRQALELGLPLLERMMSRIDGEQNAGPDCAN